MNPEEQAILILAQKKRAEKWAKIVTLCKAIRYNPSAAGYSKVEHLIERILLDEDEIESILAEID